MLSRRFRYDKKPILSLNKLQLKYKKIVEDKIDSGEYKFEKVNCSVCNKNSFELLSEKDRYGLYVPTVICKKCGLVRTNPRMNQESYNKFYNLEYWKLYIGKDHPNEDLFIDQKSRGKAILQLIEKIYKKPFTNKFVVEIGTGAGGILQVFKEIGNKVFGVDLDSEYINYGRKKGLNLKIGTVDKLDKLKEKADLIIYSHVAEHILNPVKELTKLRKYIKKTGFVYIEVPGIMYLKKTYHQDFLKYLQNAHTYHFSLRSLINVANKAGLILVYGDESINSIFKIGNVKNNYDNVYEDTITFLKELEIDRLKLFNSKRFKDIIFLLISFFLNKTKTLDIIRVIKKYQKTKISKK